jgi:hypothetical protein
MAGKPLLHGLTAESKRLADLGGFGETAGSDESCEGTLPDAEKGCNVGGTEQLVCADFHNGGPLNMKRRLTNPAAGTPVID